MKPKILFAVAMLSSLTMIAQTSKIKFTTINQVGFLSGSMGNTFQLQTINGVKYKTYSVALGAGIDNYYLKSIPLFVDLRKNFFNTKQTPFVYVDAGTNIPWRKTDNDSWQIITYSSGFYFDAGIGYKWTLFKKISLNGSFGYSEKKLNALARSKYIPIDPGFSFPDNYNYKLERFTLKFGLQL